ncbi:MAG: site-specific DNA-methyltransferase [Candidatus Izemoplasmatales bacterium]|nr:site-specific DNA-methyltransferase [Candidatus Izemoplasmatales bacterium]MDD4069803.1 site-specific DNA-methyltransferase [Candidatus Izemoplasmatales bacterium]
MNKQKLELTWVGKDDVINIEPRILIEDPKHSNLSIDTETRNMLIHGDNLLALKSLEKEFTNSIKCIYIDPPYNTGSAFEHYDDNVEHSIWLSLMKPRLEILHRLLSDDGSIFIQIDENEYAYLKVLCDQIFGRNNFVSTICVKMSTVSGVKTTHREKTIIKEKEMILVYAKNINNFRIKPQYVLIDEFDNEFQYFLERNNSDDPKKWKILRLSDILKEKGIEKTLKDKNFVKFITKNKNNIWRRAFIRNEYKKISQDNPDDIFYITKNNKENYYYRGREMFFLSSKFHECFTENGAIDGMSNLLGDIWLDINTGKLFNEGGVKFRNGKKPEFLIARILEMVTQEGDLVLDSFLGSGTTAAVAHKMNRRWIGIELGDHAYTLAKPRLDEVIKGEQGGMSKALQWQGGGGYKFYELAPTLIKFDSFGQPVINEDYDDNMLASAIAIHEGFKYAPSQECFWKQSHSSDKSFLYVTTNHVTHEYLDAIFNQMNEEETLLVSCKSYDSALNNKYKNITIKKIPNSILKNCAFGMENYNLNINETKDEEGDEVE